VNATALINRILAALLALALLLGGLLTLAEILLAALGRPPWLVPYPQWSSWLAGQTWDTLDVRLVLVGLVVIGLLLLVLALRRGRPGVVTLPARPNGPDGVQVTASRRGIEKSLVDAARRTDGVSGATATARRRSVRVDARTLVRSDRDLPDKVTAAVSQRLDELGLGGTLRPRVKLSRQESR
jgi:hypothetical protein